VSTWRLTEQAYPQPQARGHAETIFSLGNGYLGLRGNDDEGGAAYEHGTFINGFHETWTMTYPEAAYGFATVGQTLLKLPDAKTIQLEVDGQALDLATSEVQAYQRVLDFGSGVLKRRLVWRLRGGQRFSVSCKRMVSFDDKHLALLSYTVTPLDGDATLRLRSLLIDRQHAEPAVAAPGFDPRRADDLTGALRPQRHGLGGSNADRPYLAFATQNSRLGVAVMALHLLGGGAEAGSSHTAAPHEAVADYVVRAQRGQPVTLTKLVAYHDGAADEIPALLGRCQQTVTDAAAAGAELLLARQRAWLGRFWADADVQVEGHDEVQRAVRWNLFQLAQASARADGRGISAKGVSGSGYSGHYFWDTEIYVLPFLAHTQPAVARDALRFRYDMLPAARRRARVMDQAGALYPWRTINGEEASAYYPAGTAQYHIDADVAYAVAQYVAVTGDDGFMPDYGTEIAAETARMWASLGFFKRDRFHINAVTGPDEYSAVVDDNFYTNVMAAFNLRFAADALEGLARTAPQRHAQLVHELELQPGEPAAWRRAADNMALPYDAERGVHLQDARFMEREPWDLANTPASKRPLLLHYHPLVIYRHQVLKQADLVLALYLQAHRFTPEQKRADFDFYDPLTTGDSTLSAAVQSIIAAEVGHERLAMRYFQRMLNVDLADLHGNSADGVHVASAGGTWQALVAGFGGVRGDGGKLRLDPRLPGDWTQIRFLVRWRGAKIRVGIRHHQVILQLQEGAAAELWVRGSRVNLSGPEPVVIATASGPDDQAAT
jgi:alpha,alpha-trehalose phosphorylase